MIESPRTAQLPDTPRDIRSHDIESPSATTTRLLSCLMVAGPLFVALAVIQILTRPGFDLTRQALSLLTLGSWGWVQSANFIVTGLLIGAGALGTRDALRGEAGGRWSPLLLGICALGFIGAGVFHPDPSNGFPPGTLADASAVSSWHGVLHMVCGSLAFLALIVLCFVLAHRLARAGRRRWAISSRVAGTACAIGVVMAGAPDGTVTLFVGVTVALLWVSLVAAQTGADLRSRRSNQGLVIAGE